MSLLKGAKYRKRKLEITYAATDSLMPNSYNPNQHDAVSFDMLVKSLNYFGFTQPIVVDRATNEIIDGENRWRAAAVLGLQAVPVCFLDLTEEERKAATIIHNRARGQELDAQISLIEEDLTAAAPDLLKTVLLKERYDARPKRQ